MTLESPGRRMLSLSLRAQKHVSRQPVLAFFQKKFIRGYILLTGISILSALFPKVTLISRSFIAISSGKSCSGKLFSPVQFFETPLTVAYQVPLSMAFSSQEYWSGLPFLLQVIFPTQGSNPGLPHCRQKLYSLGLS